MKLKIHTKVNVHRSSVQMPNSIRSIKQSIRQIVKYLVYLQRTSGRRPLALMHIHMYVHTAHLRSEINTKYVCAALTRTPSACDRSINDRVNIKI